jgi:recombination protein RecA
MAKHSDKSALKAPLTFNAAFAQMRKKYGSNTIMLAREINVVTRIPMGIPSMDFQLGGGLPMGRIVHISGSAHSGKTFLAMQIAAAMQRFYGDKMVFWLDGERSFDSVRAEQIGIDLDRIIVSRPSSSEAGLEELIEMAPFISAGFVDSVASLSTVTESEGTMADKQVGQVAAMLSKFFHKWISATAPENLGGLVPMLTLTNQLRDDIGSYIKKTKTPGGRSMQHYPSVFIELSRGPVVKLKERDAEDEEVVIGHDVKFKIQKNNTFQPDKVGAFMLCTRPYDIGGYQLSVNQVDWPRDLLKYAVHYNVIKRSGSWHEFKGKSKMKAQGRVEAQAKLYHDGELTAEIQRLVLAEVFRSHGVKTDNDQAQVEAPGKAGSKKAVGKKQGWQRK